MFLRKILENIKKKLTTIVSWLQNKTMGLFKIIIKNTKLRFFILGTTKLKILQKPLYRNE